MENSLKRHACRLAASLLVFGVLAGCSDGARRPQTDTEKAFPTGDGTAVMADSMAAPTGTNTVAVPSGRLVGSKRIAAGVSDTIVCSDVTLLIDSGALGRDVEITILATDEGHSGRIPDHLANLTAGGGVYRMLPDGQRFERDITIAMRYDSTALPYGYTPDDIYTFFYNEQTGMWQQVERDSVDTGQQIVYSRTNHFTDYINGVLKVPENSDVTTYAPTTVKNLKAADPLEGITMVAPPEANNQGTATLSYPLAIPAGRHGMQPQLAISYSSAGGSGILGLGWSLPISEISVETRWGVPLYDSQLQTEGYLLDGTTLVTPYTDSLGNFRLSKPVYHRAYEHRDTSGRTRFYPRVEGAFRRIERHGTTPQNYYWVVTDKDGTRHFYGQHKEATLRDHNQNIAKWMLEKSVDTYGNTVTYIYDTKIVVVPGQPSGKQLCIEYIKYTGNEREGDYGKYRIYFSYANKRDKTTSFRYGMEETDNYLLDRIEVRFLDTIIREYCFGYKEGEFGKTLLCKIFEGYDDSARRQRYIVSGDSGTIRDLSPYNRCSAESGDKDIYLHLAHTFDYYGLESDGLFADPVAMDCIGGENQTLFVRYDSVLHERGSISGSGSYGWNVNGGVNAGSDYLPCFKTVSAGGHYSYGRDYSEGFVQLVDINGDGYPDKLYKTSDGLKCRPQLPGQNTFGAPVSVTGINRFQYTESSSQNYGWEASAIFIGVGKNWNDGRSNTSVYVSDINGDGLTDIVDNGRTYINRGNYHFDDVTDNDTIRSGGSCEGDAIDFSGEVDESLFEDGYYTVERVVCETMQTEYIISDTVYNGDGSFEVIQDSEQATSMQDTCWTVIDTIWYTYPKRYEPDVDLVRMWIAPYSGHITITGSAKLTDDLHSVRKETRTTDGVKVSVQRAGDTTLLASATVLPGIQEPMACQIDVTAGDTIFFRIRAAEKRLYDQVEWNPQIEYQSATHRNDVDTNMSRQDANMSRQDANGDNMYLFNYAEDYMLTARQPVVVIPDLGTPCSNNFSVACKIKANHPLSQDMLYSLVISNIEPPYLEYVTESVRFIQGTMPDTTVTWSAAEVSSSQQLVLRLSPADDGQLSWSSIETDATVTLTHSSDTTINNRLSDTAARGAYVYHPTVERVFYDYLVFPSEPVSGLVGSMTFNVDVTRTDSVPFTGSLYMTIKDGNNSVCFGKHIGEFMDSTTVSTAPFMFPTDSLLPYYVDFYTTDTSFAARIANIKVSVGNMQYNAGLYAKYAPDTSKHHGTLYRGWGQFGYKAPDTADLINSNYIHADRYYTDRDSVPHPTDSVVRYYNMSPMDEESSPEERPFGNIVNPLSGTFFEMHANAGKARWESYANLVTASRNLSILDNSDPAAENGQPVTADMFQSPLPVVSPGTKMKAVNKMTLSKGNGNTMVSTSRSKGSSRLLGDYMDLNGDRYPDNVSEKLIQYSRAQGGLGNMTRGYSSNGGINRSRNSSLGNAFGGTFLNVMRESVPNAKKSRAVSTVTGLMQLLTNDSTVSNDTTSHTFMDINGDGLADIVYDNGRVQYNMGYGFTGMRTIPTGTIRSSHSVSRAKGKGFNVRNTSISGSISCNWSHNTTTFALMDVNGDGLPDMVSPMSIQINMGDNTYSPYGSVGTDNGTSTSFSLNVSATYDVVFSIGGYPVKVGFSAGGGASASLSRSNAEFADMDNDGHVDYVYRDGTNDNIMVRYSNIGRANLLKNVTNFANGGFEIDYALSTATVQCPQRQWNMASLLVYDGYESDGESKMYKRFSYGNRHYDRFERDDYGYDTVKTYDYEKSANFYSDIVYRTTTQDFHNDSYYHARLKKRDLVSKDSGYVETRYTYGDADLQDGHWLGDGSIPVWCEGDGWPAVSVEESSHKEDTGSAIITTRREYQYGAYGNVVQVDDQGDINDGDDDYIVELDYALDSVNHIVANVSLLDIPGYRHRTATYTAEGGMDTLTVDNSPSPQSVYLYEYDTYGNVTKVTTPATNFTSGNNYWIAYTYDPLTHTLPVSVTNAEGHTSSAVYSHRWQKPLHTIDMGDVPMYYRYDNHGRIDTVVAPKEIASGAPYTVKYDYWYSRKYPNPNPNLGLSNTGNAYGIPWYFWTRTSNYDPAHPNNDIKTVTFSDGLGRIIQVKKDVEVNGTEKRAVGGTIHYDGLGRKQSEFFLVEEDSSVVGDTMLSIQSAPWQAQYNYDWRDRIVKTDYADGTSTHNKYFIAPDANGVNRFLNAVTDQNGHTSYLYTDARQLNTQVTDALGGVTRFNYDAVGQLITSKDPENNKTTHAYDRGGRRISREHPSAGQTQWDYDAAGNMTKQTQNSGESINYYYNYSRPVRIEYSNRPWNNVWYEYDTAGSGTSAGRLVRQQDATGVQEFRYDSLGNVIYNRHTYVQPGSPKTITLETRWEYDSWGRVQSILYPDSEDVRYYYDRGGNVNHIEGTKPGQTTTQYIKQLRYDVYGQRIYQQDGNDVETHYNYNPLNRRLDNLNDYSSRTGQYLQNINYTYDAAGNILQINDYGLHPRSQSFEYDSINRLVVSSGNVNCYGNSLGYDASYSYSPAGRILTKNVSSQRVSPTLGYHSVNYRNNYTYQTDNPFAIEEVLDAQSGIMNEFGWDANGNMTYARCGSPVQKRNLCWTEDNRLQGYTEYSDEGEKISAWYNYTADGERNFKIVSQSLNMRQNAVDYHFNVLLRDPTLYASALVTLTKHGYTKHYYEGTNRICSKIGGGFSHIGRSRIDDTVPSLEGNYDFQFLNQKECVWQTFGCLGFGVDLPCIANLYKVMGHEIVRNAPEPAFYYHSDHLGSAAYLTNDSGVVTQALNYLPYGEDWVDDQKQVELQYPRLGIYTFNGKEKDYESGFHYYGARYYWSELLTGWLSVDPMMDKYPSMSPYNYCMLNPIRLTDPNGQFPILPLIWAVKATARGVEHFSQNSAIKTYAYAVNHPYNAVRTGWIKDGGKNGISSFAHNFSVGMCDAASLDKGSEGSQRNAIRHTLWQAMLTNELGPAHAERIGNNHENGPKVDLSQRTFRNMKEADMVCDQLNNAIGRSIGERNMGANNATMAEKVATEFHNNGLWTATKGSDGTVFISKTKINNTEYQKVIKEIKNLNNYGLHE